MIVVDASLAAKWFLAEVDSDEAQRFFQSRRAALHGPDVLMVEVARALVTASNTRRMTSAEARSAIEVWLELLEDAVVTLHRVEPRHLRRATRLALDLGHPLPDCLYLALAIELDCEFVTCDAKFRDKAVSLHPRVRLLSEFN